MPKRSTVYLGLGSNLGNKRANIKNAAKMLDQHPHIKILQMSPVIESEPLGDPSHPNFCNAVAQLQTSLTPASLLRETKKIESAIGRIPAPKWSPRIIDIDILIFDAKIIGTKDLTIPHRQMHLRSFVLNPLRKIAPDLIHPVLKEDVTTLARRLNNGNFAFSPESRSLVCVAGLIGVGKTTLIDNLAKTIDCVTIHEPYSKNPFLPEVYKGNSDLSLDCQLFFLINRIKQIPKKSAGSNKLILADYIFEKELIYAQRLLDRGQLKLYKQIYKSLAKAVMAPELVIYLIDTPENCRQRIIKRNRSYEQNIETAFLKSLKSDYDELFKTWNKSPLIKLQVAEYDTTKNKNIEHLAKQIRYYTQL